MNRFAKVFLTATLVTSAVSAQTPSIGGVLNAASYSRPPLPNSSIAQGSIFAIFGSSLGPAGLATAAAYPLPTSEGLVGTTITVTSGGTSAHAILLAVTPSQVNAVLPNNVPTGAAQVSVTANGQTSDPFAITVVPRSFGIFTANAAGTGPAIITSANYVLTTLRTSAHPGDVVILWGTGLGAGTTDESLAPPPQINLLNTGLALDVWVANQKARVLYAGRAAFTGEDQINFQIPSGVSGCYVSVTVAVGGTVSNFASLAVDPSGASCADANGISSAALEAAVQTGGKARVGSVNLTSYNLQVTPVNVPITLNLLSDMGSATFASYSDAQLSASQGFAQQPSVGSCMVTPFLGTTFYSSSDSILSQGTPLDAGSHLSISGSPGTKTMTRGSAGAYAGTLGGMPIDQALIYGCNPCNPSFLVPGKFTITGSGGAEVGPFSATASVPPTLIWTNEYQFSTIDRAQDLSVAWSGGDPDGFVTVFAMASTTNTSYGPYPTTPGAEFLCIAKNSAHIFTVPSVVLSSLPATLDTGGNVMPLGFLLVGQSKLSETFTATGLDAGYVFYLSYGGKNLGFK